MHIKKTLAVAAVTVAVGAATFVGVGAASAASTTSNTKTDPMSSLVDALVSKFNLKKADVQAVFDAQKTTMDKQREADAAAEIKQLVTDGKLTQAQADAITVKRAALQKEHDANRSSMNATSDTERKAVIEAEKTALDAWLKEQGISTDYAYLLMGGHGGHGPGGPRGSSTSSSSSSN